MRNHPTHPMDRANLGILAVCEDILARDPNRTRARIVAEITQQLNHREAGDANNAPASNHD